MRLYNYNTDFTIKALILYNYNMVEKSSQGSSNEGTSLLNMLRNDIQQVDQSVHYSKIQAQTDAVFYENLVKIYDVHSKNLVDVLANHKKHPNFLLVDLDRNELLTQTAQGHSNLTIHYALDVKLSKAKAISSLCDVMYPGTIKYTQQQIVNPFDKILATLTGLEQSLKMINNSITKAMSSLDASIKNYSNFQDHHIGGVISDYTRLQMTYGVFVGKVRELASIPIENMSKKIYENILKPDPSFTMKAYATGLEQELNSFKPKQEYEESVARINENQTNEFAGMEDLLEDQAKKLNLHLDDILKTLEEWDKNSN